MKSGFTLIEVLAVLVLLGIISLIAYPIVSKSVNESKERAYQLQIDNIEQAAYKWSIDNINELSKDLITSVNVPDLISGGYITKTKDGKLYNPKKSSEIMNGCVIIGYSTEYNQYIYNYDEECKIPEYKTPSYCFEFDTTTETITGYNYDGIGCTTDIVIPDTIDDIEVQHIGYAAFVGKIISHECIDAEGESHEVDLTYIHYEEDEYMFCAIESENHNPITSVVLPKNIITIESWAFGNNQLKNLDLNHFPQLTKINSLAFAFNQLNSLTFSNLPQLTEINIYAFAGNQLNSLILNDLPQLTIVDFWAFSHNQLNSLTLNNLPNLMTIGYGAFALNQLEKLDLNKLPQLTKISAYAFAYNQLNELNLNDLPKLAVIGCGEGEFCPEVENGFSFGGNHLTELNLSNLPELTIIRWGSFAENELEEITLNNLPNLTTISKRAFWKSSDWNSNFNLTNIVNSIDQSFDWSDITGSNTSGQIFKTGTIIHQDGNIEVLSE